MYNAEQYIWQCISSIINQPINTDIYEIIVINDGSNDNSLKVAQTIASKTDNIRVLDQANRGVSATRNKGIEVANGEYIWFIDADDYIADNVLSKLLRCVEDNQLDIVEFKKIRTESRILTTASQEVSGRGLQVFKGTEFVSKLNFNDSACVYLYSKQLLFSSGIRFEGVMMEDMLFNARIVPKAYRVARYPLDVYRYVITPNSLWNTRTSKKLKKSIKDSIHSVEHYAKIIRTYQNSNIDVSIFESKIQNMLFNIAKRLLASNFSVYEKLKIIKNLESQVLYPMKGYPGKNKFRKYTIILFNHRHLFVVVGFIYNFLKKPIEYLIVKRYYKKREKKLRAQIN